MINSYITRTYTNDNHFNEMVHALDKHLFPITSLDYHNSSLRTYKETKESLLDPAKILFVYLYDWESIIIGKGMYKEIQEFLAKGGDEIYLISSSNFIDDRYEIYKMNNISFGKLNEHDWNRYTTINFDAKKLLFEFDMENIIAGSNFIDYIKSMNKVSLNDNLLIKCL